MVLTRDMEATTAPTATYETTFRCGHTARTEGTRPTACPTCDTLPALTGTDKQIAWAIDIRADLIKETAILARQHGETYAEKIPAAWATFLEIPSTESDAKWYIDNGRKPARNILLALNEAA